MVFNTPMSNIHSIDTGHGDMIAFTQETEHGIFWAAGTASGPLGTGWKDHGPLYAGKILALAYDYDTDNYMGNGERWYCEVVRVNRKSVTVKSSTTGKTQRVEI